MFRSLGELLLALVQHPDIGRWPDCHARIISCVLTFGLRRCNKTDEPDAENPAATQWCHDLLQSVCVDSRDDEGTTLEPRVDRITTLQTGGGVAVVDLVRACSNNLSCSLYAWHGQRSPLLSCQPNGSAARLRLVSDSCLPLVHSGAAMELVEALLSLVMHMPSLAIPAGGSMVVPEAELFEGNADGGGKPLLVAESRSAAELISPVSAAFIQAVRQTYEPRCYAELQYPAALTMWLLDGSAVDGTMAAACARLYEFPSTFFHTTDWINAMHLQNFVRACAQVPQLYLALVSATERLLWGTDYDVDLLAFIGTLFDAIAQAQRCNPLAAYPPHFGISGTLRPLVAMLSLPWSDGDTLICDPAVYTSWLHGLSTTIIHALEGQAELAAEIHFFCSLHHHSWMPAALAIACIPDVADATVNACMQLASWYYSPVDVTRRTALFARCREMLRVLLSSEVVAAGDTTMLDSLEDFLALGNDAGPPGTQSSLVACMVACLVCAMARLYPNHHNGCARATEQVANLVGAAGVHMSHRLLQAWTTWCLQPDRAHRELQLSVLLGVLHQRQRNARQAGVAVTQHESGMVQLLENALAEEVMIDLT